MATVTKSVLSAKLGDKLKKAVNAHKTDETKFDTGGSLPAGIENGIAQLTECKFDVIKPGAQNAGQPFFYAAGVIVSPDAHDGVPLKGRRTSIMEVLFDTPTRSRKTTDDHVDWVLNEMRKLGADTSTMDGSGESLEALASALKEAAPHFRFRTWKGEKQTTGPYAGREPRVQETWQGQVAHDDVTDATTGVQDDTPAPDETGVSDETPVDETAPEEPEPVDYTAMSLEDLVTNAANDVEAAQDEIHSRAKAAGIDKDEVDNAESWDAVKMMIEEKENAPADEPAPPKKGDVYKYQVIDAKTKKPAVDPKTKKPAKPVEVEIVSVDNKTKTVTAKNLDTNKAISTDGKTALKIPFDSLIAV